MAKIDVTMDVANVDTASNKLSSSLDQIQDRIKEIISVENTFNAAGVQVGATIRGITKDGQTFTATLGVMEKDLKDLAAAGTNVALSLKGIKYGEKAADAKKLNDETKDLGDNTGQLKGKLVQLAQSFQYFATYKAFNLITQGIKDGVFAAKDFQIEISKIRTITQGKDQQSFGKTGNDIRNVSDSTGLGLDDVAKAFYDTTSNQVAKGSGVAGFVKQAGELARVTGSTTTDAVNLLSSRINAYGLSASDAEKVSAQFFKTIDEGRVIASEMANTIGRVDVVAKNLGISMEEVNATIAITTQKGFTTSDSMTLLTNIMAKLEKPTEATSKFFKSMGATSGEAAIAISGGLVPLLRQIVEQTKSGILPVSAFFDEIRGRKQFGVFEQSIDDIDRFQKQLKDTKAVINEFNTAIEIRGESPADKLVKETNKLKNVFKADLGQVILQRVADFAQLINAGDQLKANASSLVSVVEYGAVAFAAYAASLTAISIASQIATINVIKFGAAAKVTGYFFLPLLAGYALGQKLFKPEGENPFGDVDPKKVESLATAVGKMNAELKAKKQLEEGGNADVFQKQNEALGSAYSDVQKIIANAIVQNGNLLDGTKSKSKEIGDTLKVTFASWDSTLQDKITRFKKNATEAREEVEKSMRSVLKYQDTLDKLLIDTKMQYANDDFGKQKINLLNQGADTAQAKADKLFGTGNRDDAEEARRLYDEAAKLKQQAFTAETEFNKKQFELSLQQNPQFQNPNGPNVFLVDTIKLEQDLNKLRDQRNKAEKDYLVLQDKKRTAAEGAAKYEEDNLKRLKQAFADYSKIQLENKDGSVATEFANPQTKAFDRSKLDAELDKQEAKIRENAGGSYEARLQLEQQFLQNRRALYAEAAVLERQDFLRGAQQRALVEGEDKKKAIDAIKKDRDDRIKVQSEVLEAYQNKGPELAAFGNKLSETGSLRSGKTLNDGTKTSDFIPGDQTLINRALNDYAKALRDLESSKIVSGGVTILDPEKAAAATKSYQEALDLLIKIQRETGKGSLTVNGVTAGQAKDAAQYQLRDARENSFGLLLGVSDEAKNKQQFDETIVKPFQKLKELFPDLQKSATDFTQGTANQFQNLSTSPGLDQLIQKLKEVQRLMPPGGIPPANKAVPLGLLDGGVDAAYAATGGIAGMFPGQPRGEDRYPIWAARGETIVNARSSALYAPQLEAIQNRRMPQYMAEGGRVGGDTNVGDINVTINGGNTNADTARVIGTRLEREIRRRVVNLNGKRT